MAVKKQRIEILILGMHPIGRSLADRFKDFDSQIAIINDAKTFRNTFDPEPFVLTAPEILPLIEIRDRKENLFEIPKSKYHK